MTFNLNQTFFKTSFTTHRFLSRTHGFSLCFKFRLAALTNVAFVMQQVVGFTDDSLRTNVLATTVAHSKKSLTSQRKYDISLT